MRSTETNFSKIQRALNYYSYATSNNNHFWIAIGKTNPWPNEELPPLPSPSLSILPECYGFVYVHRIQLCAKDPLGDILVKDGSFKAVESLSLPILINAKAFNIYFEASFLQEYLPSSYRALGLCCNLEFFSTPPILQEGAFVPFNAVSKYNMEWVYTFKKVVPTPLSTNTLQLMRNF